MTEGSAEYYDRKWRDLGGVLAQGEQEKGRLAAILRALTDVPLGTSVGTILDLGCGRGWMTPTLARFGAVTGIDLSGDAIEIARENFGSFADFSVASIDLTLPRRLGSGRFDVVVCSEVIEHLEDPSILPRICSEILRRGGFVFVTTPNGAVWEKCRRQERFSKGFQPVENWLTPKQLEEGFESAGLRVLRHDGIPMRKVRVGWMGAFEHPSVQLVVHAVGADRIYRRFLRKSSVYQMLVAQKD